MKLTAKFVLPTAAVSLMLVGNAFGAADRQLPLDRLQTGHAKFEALAIPRRLIAIDNVCAWPNLTTLRDGTIVATIYNRPDHGLGEGDLECWASADGGLTWKYRGTPTQHAPGTNRMNAAAGLGRNGELIVLSGGWMNVVPKRQNPQSRRIEASISISNDGGRSWTRGGEMPPIPVPGLSHHTPFGDILTAKNGDLVVGTYVHEMPVPVDDPKPRSEWVGHVYALRSKDGGRSWTHVTPIVRGAHVEAAMLHVGEGKWVAASRRFGPLDLEVHASNDDGYTWERIASLGIPSVSAAHLLKLSDGRILLTYGNRSPANCGIDARCSSDGGRTWSSPQRIINLDEPDNGYPAAVELPAGRVCIAYYVAGIPEHRRYHMGVVNLVLEELIGK